MPHLFDPLVLRGVSLPHRILVSPMCQYSSTDGFATDWHLVHLGSRAAGGAAAVMTEATAVTAEGRISPRDLGIWSDDHVPALERVTRFLRAQRSMAAIQLAHAGRKASTAPPWEGTVGVLPDEGGWIPVGPTPTPFNVGSPVPRALSTSELPAIVEAFKAAAVRALHAGFEIAEVHAAHGYLIQEFLSPLVNTRTDRYGGSFENRTRLCLEIVEGVRSVWPDQLPLFVRISATDWAPGGWDLEQSIALACLLRDRGVDLVDCSSGGAVPHQQIQVGPLYQVPFAERIRREAHVPTGAVGMITTPAEADDIIRSGRADCVLLARELLRDPYWPLRAARELGHQTPWPKQYLRAAPPDTSSR
jgi:2,4-dienoyl-CoA reductase-like NADH-dependent reductase (Old Yellow Enzyme family)